MALSCLSILKYCPHWSQRLKIANSQRLKSNIFCGTVVFMPSVICQNKHSSSSNQQIESNHLLLEALYIYKFCIDQQRQLDAFDVEDDVQC